MAALLEFPGTDTRVSDRLEETLRVPPSPTSVDDRSGLLRQLVASGLADLPQPACGSTLTRWRALARVARHDLALVKWYESHADALAILAEIEPGRAVDRASIHAVWASESRDQPLTICSVTQAGEALVEGRKMWCSGADLVDVGLMTAAGSDGLKYLVEVRLDAPGLRIERERWQAVGMAASGSFDVVCHATPARIVGPANAYLDRPGFWQGGAGVAACWHGAAAAVGTRVRDLQVGRSDVHALAHLGAIDAALAATAALLREAAATIDAAPRADAMRIALRLRGAVADATGVVVEHARRALGPGPFCHEADLATRVADLPVFVAQSRAEHDRVAQARALLADDGEMARSGWAL